MKSSTTKPVVALALAGALLVAQAAGAQQGEPAAPAAKPDTPAAPGTNGEADAKPEPGAPTKPEASPQTPAAGGSGETPQPEGALSPLGELTKEGFEIHATSFIPADAVTRQSGKVSSDAIVVTLQKSNATAVCFYTLKAYVSKKLTTIPACTVHR